MRPVTQEPRTGRQRRRLTATTTDLEVVKQKAYLIGVVRGKDNAAEAETSLHELALLTDTAGSEPTGEPESLDDPVALTAARPTHRWLPAG